MDSTKSADQMPPRCCETRPFLPLIPAASLMTKHEQADWNHKLDEFTTLDRIYCHFNKCAAWIKPRYIALPLDGDGGRRKAFCKDCKRFTCDQCKRVWHTGITCHNNDDGAGGGVGEGPGPALGPVAPAAPAAERAGDAPAVDGILGDVPAAPDPVVPVVRGMLDRLGGGGPAAPAARVENAAAGGGGEESGGLFGRLGHGSPAARQFGGLEGADRGLGSGSGIGNLLRNAVPQPSPSPPASGGGFGLFGALGDEEGLNVRRNRVRRGGSRNLPGHFFGDL